MRPAILCLAALALAACGQARGIRETDTVPTLEVRRRGRCACSSARCRAADFARWAGVGNGPYRQMQEEAFRLRANALIIQSYASDQAIAVQFTSPGCQS